MSRWQPLIDGTLRNLANETFGIAEFRLNVDHKIGEAETMASNSKPFEADETADRRRKQFVAELYQAIAACRESEPSNRIWQLAFLEHPDLRSPVIHQIK